MASNSQKSQMPEEYAAKMRAARNSRSMQGERRIVTILFCDVTGSTSMAEQLDPEEWAEIMDNAFDFLIAPVYRYEGTVARLMGDAILAFFGAPIAHEDDPQRAILAALDILDSIQPFREEINREYGMDFNVRIGINTGPVVVGEIGSDLAVEYTAMGDAVNLAARMEQAAQPGTVQISGNTYKLVAPLFDFEALGGIEVKGKQEPVTGYRVRGRKADPGRLRGIPGLSAPLVGRSNEMEKLRGLAEGVRRGRGEIVCLMGEAGLGKSRLIEELHADWVSAGEGHLPWFESRGISYDTTHPYGLFHQHLRQICDVKQTDSPEVVREKVAAALAGATPQRQDTLRRAVDMLLLAEAEPAHSQLEGEAFKRELFDTLLELWRDAASETALVMVLDDLHWADTASVELLQYLFQLVDQVPILFLCAMRPYRHAPGWQARLAADTHYPHRYTEFYLRPLSDEDSDLLVNSLLTISDLPLDLRRLVLQKAEGNPFFVEEVVRTLLENGVVVRDESGTRWRADAKVEDISIPDSLQALLIARIDRLEEEVRRTLQLAAVIGRSFYYQVLKYISDAAAELDQQLNTLQRVELILEASRVPELEYMFRHELTRDAAYDSILRRRRRQFHLQVGEAIERLFPERLGEEAHRLAYHFREGNDSERAIKYYTLAGDSAARLYANKEAITQYTHAIELAGRKPPDGEQLVYLYSRRGRTLELDGNYDKALQNYQELLALGEARGDRAMQLAGLIPQATIYSTPTVKFDPEMGRSISQRSLPLAKQIGDHRAEARVLWNLMLLADHTGQDLAGAVAYGEESLAIARQHDYREELAYTLNDIARPYLEVGRLEDAWKANREAQSLWRELNNLPMLADSLITFGQGMYIGGRLDQALEAALEGYQISQKIQSTWGQSYALAVIGPVYFDRGEIDAGLQALDMSLQLGEQANFTAPKIYARGLLGWIYDNLGWEEKANLLLGDLLSDAVNDWGVFAEIRLISIAKQHLAQGETDLAGEAYEKLENHVIEHGTEPYTGSFVAYFGGNYYLSHSRFDRTLAFLEAQLGRMQTSGVRVFLPDILLIKARALLGLGDAGAAGDILIEAIAEARSQGSRRGLWRALAHMARLETERGDAASADRYRQEARENVEFIAANIGDPELRQAFLSLAAADL